MRTGQRLELRLVYGGEVLSEAAPGLLYVGARGTWYPNRGLAMADFDLEFRYPAGWTLVATGKRANAKSPPDLRNPGTGGDPLPSEQVSRWVSERPIPLAGFDLGRYEQVTAQAFGATRRGGKTVSIGLPHPNRQLTIPASTLVAEERQLMGSYMGSCVPQRDIPRFIGLYRAGMLPVGLLKSREIKLDQVNEAFDALDRGDVARQVIRFQ